MLVSRSWLPVISVIMLLFACSRGIENVEVKAPFHQFATLKDGADERLAPFMDSLQHVEKLRPFMDSAANAYGYPLWEHAVIGIQSGGLMVLAPMVRNGGSRVSGLIALKNNGKFSVRIFDAEKPGKYGYGKGLSARNVFIAADLFNQRAFDHDGAAINDPCMMSRMERAYITGARMAKPGMTITLTAREIVGYVETCYYTTVCTGDGSGNCIGEVVVQRDCILSAVWVDDNSGYDMGYNPYPDDYSFGQGNGTGGTPTPSNDCDGAFGENEQEALAAVLPPSKPITDVTKYLGCFSSNKGAIITFFADQPLAGSSEPFSMKEKVGHAFLTIEQLDNGNITRRTIGFHPSDAVSPFLSKSSESLLGDDSNEPYDVRLDVSVTPAVLEHVLGLIQNYNPTYHLENYNCTNFVLDIADACGVKVNRTKGSWVVGSGLNPANFGEDLKKMRGAVAGPGKSKENAGNCN
ncbi:hypothetical protein [Chitinophaga sp.]|uniref:hypothetical protein n=1 Tax=Chitinophaga sp. TaxID=1869181 RepID=UPI0031DB0E54